MYFNHNVRFLIYSIVLTDVKARIQPVNPTVFVIDPLNLTNTKGESIMIQSEEQAKEIFIAKNIIFDIDISEHVFNK